MQGEKEVAIDQAGSNQPPDSRVQKNESLLNNFALPPHPILDNFFRAYFVSPSLLRLRCAPLVSISFTYMYIGVKFTAFYWGDRPPKETKAKLNSILDIRP